MLTRIHGSLTMLIYKALKYIFYFCVTFSSFKNQTHFKSRKDNIRKVMSCVFFFFMDRVLPNQNFPLGINKVQNYIY